VSEDRSERRGKRDGDCGLLLPVPAWRGKSELFFLEVMTGNMTSTFHQKGKNNFRPFWSETGCYFWNPAGYLVADDVAIAQSRLGWFQRERMPKINDEKTKKIRAKPDLI